MCAVWFDGMWFIDVGDRKQGYLLWFTCFDVPSPFAVGPDQYVVPGPFSCKAGGFGVDIDTPGNLDRVFGDIRGDSREMTYR
jgi:hypothetical protein